MLAQVYGAECIAICLSMLLGIRLVIRGDGKATISKILVCPAFCFRLVIVFTSTALGAALPLLLSELGVDPAHAGATIQVLLGCRVYSSNETRSQNVALF